jgi:hypothetical protein
MAVKRKVRATVAEHIVESAPVILDAGSRSKAAIRQLKEGRGPLKREVDEIVHEARSSSTVPAGGVLPVVIVYRQKRRRRSRLGIPTPFDLFRA